MRARSPGRPTGADAHTETFTEDGCFVVAKGTRCAWSMRETMGKLHVILKDERTESPE